MKQPVQIGDIIAAILEDLRVRNLDAVFEEEWTDVTDLLHRASIRGYMLDIRIGEGAIVPHRLNGRTYVRKRDLETLYSTNDFSINIRRHA